MRTAALLLVALLTPVARGEEVADAPALVAAQAPGAPASDAPFVCPEEGRVAGDAPADYHEGADARCVAAGSLAVLYGLDGTPLPRMTRVGPGWYFNVAGYRLADEQFRRVQRERNACRDELARQVPLPGVPVAPPVVAAGRRWPTGVVVAGAVLGLALGGYVGCRVSGGCR